MTAPHATLAPGWSVRLVADLTASDQTAKNLVAGLSAEQLNWQAAPGAWSVGQCLEHLCKTNEAYLDAMAAALKGKPDSPVEQIAPGWFGRWFVRSFVEPSPNTKRVSAPGKIRPMARVEVSVIDRFLSVNQACRDLIIGARDKDVNRIRFSNPLLPLLRFTVGTAFEIICSHERRHLLQAERVRSAANFPR